MKRALSILKYGNQALSAIITAFEVLIDKWPTDNPFHRDAPPVQSTGKDIDIIKPLP